MAESSGYMWLWDTFSEAEAHIHAVEKLVFAGRSAFQRIEIADLASYGRCLILDGEIQSHQADEFIYHETLVQPAMTLFPDPRRVLLIGGGEGATLREVLRHPTVEEAVMVELDPVMLEAAREHLPSFHAGAFDDPRTRIVCEDGRAYLERPGEPFDVIFLDITNPSTESPSQLLFTREFYEIVRKRLARGGWLGIQGDACRFTGLQTFPVVVRTLREVFPRVHPSIICIPSYGSDWGYAIAGDGHGADPLSVTAEEIDRRLSERGVAGLRFYDGMTHERIFRLPKHIRAAIEGEGRVNTDQDPIRERFPGRW
ncbi:MAG: fused MFS/spermidine synthase [Planctomycetes bacterium]|nr:fused MFS/spermidine synthase [Planctomycetota bacterium]